MNKGCDVKQNALPFGTLVMEICKDHGIRVRPEMTVPKPMVPLNTASFQRSQGHSGGPTSRHEEPPTRGVDEVQDKLDAEVERELEAEIAQQQPHQEAGTNIGTSTRHSLRDIMLGIETKQAEIL